MRQSTNETGIVIIGGGLSGLYAAWLLQQAGVTDFVVLEARQRTGGRVLSVPFNKDGLAGGSSFDRFDLGPSWFWPDMQGELATLIQSLELEAFQQYENGDLVGERSALEGPVRMRGYVNSPPSMRLLGGTQRLIEALQEKLEPGSVMTGETVKALTRHESHVDISSLDESGRLNNWRSQQVLLALPPRLAVSSIEFVPPLPDALTQQWRATPTWMAPHAKYVAVYDEPFWREHGLSGEARSLCGPMHEIHDASVPGGHAALFGFLGVPAAARRGMNDQMLKEVCREQLGRLFGARALLPQAELVKDWVQDIFTATAADEQAVDHHSRAPASRAAEGVWQDCLTGIGSEWSVAYPGYLAGAVDAARDGVEGLLGSGAE